MSETFKTFCVQFRKREDFLLASSIVIQDSDLSENCDIGYADMIYSFFDDESRVSFLGIIIPYGIWRDGIDFEIFET